MCHHLSTLKMLVEINIGLYTEQRMSKEASRASQRGTPPTFESVKRFQQKRKARRKNHEEEAKNYLSVGKRHDKTKFSRMYVSIRVGKQQIFSFLE